MTALDLPLDHVARAASHGPAKHDENRSFGRQEHGEWIHGSIDSHATRKAEFAFSVYLRTLWHPLIRQEGNRQR